MPAHQGFIGSAWIQTTANPTGIGLFLTGSSLNPVQEINAPDIVQGQIVKHLWNEGKIEIGGNIQANIDENHQSIFDAAWNRNTTYPDHMDEEHIVVKISYYRSAGANARIVNNLAIASYEVSVNAGDVATFTCEFMGASVYDNGALTPALQVENFNNPAACAKLVTWDRCFFTITGFNVAIQSFTFNVNNNLQRVFKIRSSNTVAQNEDPAATLYPVELVAGFRELTGSVTAFAGDAGTGDTPDEGAPESQFQPAGASWLPNYNATVAKFGAENWSAYEANDMKSQVEFVIGEGMATPIIDQTFQAVFKRPEASAKTDIQTYTLSWTGLCFDSL